MARNRLAGVETTQAAPESAVAKEPGGASGLTIGVGEAAVSPRALTGLPVKRARDYRVLNGGHIMYGNCRTAIRAGKVISDAHFDIELLKRQGIRLEPLEQETQEPHAAAS